MARNSGTRLISHLKQAVSVASLRSDVTPKTSLVKTAVSQVLRLPLYVQAAAAGRKVPSFIHTFSMPALSASFPTKFTSASSMLPVISSVVPPCSQQAFIGGPGFSSVPFKLVSQITSGKYIDLEELQSGNCRDQESEPQLLFDGRAVFTSCRPKQRI